MSGQTGGRVRRHHQAPVSTVLRDDFDRPVPRGEAVGSQAGAVRRLGVDRESVMSVDHGALRIGTLATSSWGSATLCYGPMVDVPGRASCITLLNGHNTSESYALGSVARRVGRWAKGSETDPLWRRAIRYPRSAPREPLHRKIRYWWANRGDDNPGRMENLLVGWFTTPTPVGPADATGVVVRATGPFNGELTATSGPGLVPLFRGLQNLPVHYVTLKREAGHIHFAGSPYTGARGLPPHSWLRPLAIDPRALPHDLYVGVSQGCSGQIGFSCDTRVHEVRVLDIPTLATWRTTAIVADRFAGPTDRGSGPAAEVGGPWVASGAALSVDDRGLGLAATSGTQGALTATPSADIGLVHVLLEGLTAGEEVALLWRRDDPDNECCVEISPGACAVVARRRGEVVAREGAELELDDGIHSVQIADDGVAAVITVDGHAVLRLSLDGVASGPDVGVRLSGRGAARLRDFEAHARQIRAPEGLLPDVETVQLGDELWFVDEFGIVTDDLDGMSAGPAGVWRRRTGPGRLQVPASGTASFDASLERPVESRTAYLLDWPDPDHCDIELVGAPPARVDGRSGQRCRIGLQLWQDDDTFMVVNIYLDDAYPAASASTFFTFQGFEDIYDAVWSNLGDLVSWEKTFRLRLVSDGVRFLVLVNDEPVLHRAFSDVHPSTNRLAVRRAGIVANWEWGHDTGSRMQRFVARRRTVGAAGELAAQ